MMSQALRVRLVTAILLALMGVTLANQVVPNIPGFGGVAYADECANSSC
jgi:hypothetical protein